MITPIYRQVEGSQESKPLEIDETSSKHVVYLRKNIEQITVEDEEGTTTCWKYEEAILSKADYEIYKKQTEDAKTIEAQQEQIDMLMQCVMEMSELVYA